jgi:hypothetical protein
VRQNGRYSLPIFDHLHDAADLPKLIGDTFQLVDKGTWATAGSSKWMSIATTTHMPKLSQFRFF